MLAQVQLIRTLGVNMRPSRVVAGPRVAAVAPSGRTAVVAGVARRQQVNAAAVETINWSQVAADLEPKSPLEVMDHALKTFGKDVGIAFSGAEDVALIEYAHLTGRPYRVFSLDTGRLNPETYQLFDKVEKHYGIRIEYTFPEAQEVQELVRTKGLFSFYEDGHTECCRIRKVKPLRKQLKGLKAWITGQRKDQSPGTRQEVPTVQVDPVFEGLSGGPGSLVKYNPLTNATSAEVWNFIRVMNVPYNVLHEQGYISIGCEPCTKPVLPNQAEREGRWWWEDAKAKECGLHSGNVKKEDGTTEARKAERDLWIDGRVATLSKEQVRDIAAGKRDKDIVAVLYAPWCPFCQALEPAWADLADIFKGTHVTVAKYQADVDREFSNENLGLKTFPTIVYFGKGRTGYVKFPSERRDPETLRMWVKSVAGTA